MICQHPKDAGPGGLNDLVPPSTPLEQLDPAFTAAVLPSLAPQPWAMNYWVNKTSTLAPTLHHTEFRARLVKGSIDRVWPPNQCLFFLDLLPKSHPTRCRMLTWQGPRSLMSAIGYSEDQIEFLTGSFYSGADPFALDLCSERVAAAQRTTAQSMVTRDAAALFSPLLSYDLGLELGRQLSQCGPRPAAADHFLQGVVAGMLPLARGKRP